MADAPKKKPGKKGRVKTAASIATEKARAVLKDAKAKLAKQDNEANKDAVAKAKEKVNELAEIENRERFILLGGPRVGKILAAFDTLSNCANVRGYTFDADKVAEMFKAIDDKRNAVKQMFDTALTPSAKTEEGKITFKFSTV